MDYKQFYIDLIKEFLIGKIRRNTIAERMNNKIPIDIKYTDNVELLVNCEWGLRHADEDGYYTTESELRYYLDCLTGKKDYSNDERDKSIN